MAKERLFQQDFTKFTAPGSMGVVKDINYTMCKWPALDKPIRLFAKGSSGLEVQGPPAPRNIIFPDDTRFLGVFVNETKDFTSSDRAYRETKIVTSNVFYVLEEVTEDITETIMVNREVEVEPGLFHHVQYTKPVTTRKTFMTPREISREEAIKIADGTIIRR